MKTLIRRFLISDNYIALLFLFWSAWIGYSIKQGDKFEYHFAVSMVSLALTMIGHFGSNIFITVVLKKKSYYKISLVVLNYVAAFWYIWATYVGFLIRQGHPFQYHFTISIASFFFSLFAHLLSSLYMILKDKEA